MLKDKIEKFDSKIDNAVIDLIENKEIDKKRKVKYFVSALATIIVLDIIFIGESVLTINGVKYLYNKFNTKNSAEEMVEDKQLDFPISSSTYVEVVDAEKSEKYVLPVGYVAIGTKGLKRGADATNPDNYIDAQKVVAYSAPEGYVLVGSKAVRVSYKYNEESPEGYKREIKVDDAIRVEDNGIVRYVASHGGILVGDKEVQIYYTKTTNDEHTQTLKK